MVTLYLNQDYHKLKQECQHQGKKFIDPDFPPDGHSLGMTNEAVIWKRPEEICPNPQLVVKGLSPDDATQGFVGDCWFVAACSALTLEKDLWSRVVPDFKEQEWDPAHPDHHCGIFHFRFWRFGEWVDVVVDDLLPVRQTGPNQYEYEPVFMKSQDKNEFWASLLEKAYAKMAGSYKAIAGGQTGNALVDFTGGVSEDLELVHEGVATDERKRELLYKDLLKAHHRHSMITCAIALTPGDPTDKVLSCGLVKGHAYTVTDIREMRMGSFFHREKVHMIKLRNPWGHKEWQGPWSDGSKEWLNVPDREKRNMGLVVADDGEFWMEFEDCVQWFTNMTICRLLSKRRSLHEVVFHGIWEGKTAGGCSNFRRTFFNNPQYAFTVHHSDEVVVSLMQKNAHPGVSNYHIGFILMKVEDDRQQPVSSPLPEVGRVVFVNRRDVFGEFTLDEGRYVVVPSTFNPGLEKPFLLRLYTDKRIDAMELTGQPSHDSGSGLFSAVRQIFSPLFTAVEWPETQLKKEHKESQ